MLKNVCTEWAAGFATSIGDGHRHRDRQLLGQQGWNLLGQGQAGAIQASKYRCMHGSRSVNVHDGCWLCWLCCCCCCCRCCCCNFSGCCCCRRRRCCCTPRTPLPQRRLQLKELRLLLEGRLAHGVQVLPAEFELLPEVRRCRVDALLGGPLLRNELLLVQQHRRRSALLSRGRRWRWRWRR